MGLIIPILVLGLLASLSPSTIVVFILLLGTLRAKLNAVAFMIGWGISLTIVFVVSYEIGGAGPLQNRGGRAGVDIVEILLGVGLCAVAVREWRSRSRPRKSSKVSQRLTAHLKELHPWEASVVGILEQPWTLTAAAAVVVVHHHDAAAIAVLAFLCFTVLSTATVGILFLYYSRRPGEAKVRLVELEAWMQRAGPALIAAVSFLVGLYLIVDGMISLVGN